LLLRIVNFDMLMIHEDGNSHKFYSKLTELAPGENCLEYLNGTHYHQGYMLWGTPAYILWVPYTPGVSIE